MQSLRRWSFWLFLLSGMSGLIYQIVWLRLAFASFGVVTPVISLVLSAFMLGLGAGSWVAGRLMASWSPSPRVAWRCYAATEFVIGIGAFTAPALFRWSEAALLPAGASDSTTYLAASALAVVASLAPFCFCMGLTYPLMLQALGGRRSGGEDHFSYLYLANVLGALLGAFLTPVALVELLGFRGALIVGLLGNWLAAAVAWRLSQQAVIFENAAAVAPSGVGVAPASISSTLTSVSVSPSQGGRFPWIVLFLTGFSSLALEVVWTRAFTPVIQTQVYSFASLLFVYLLSTWLGSAWYRRQLTRGRSPATAYLLLLLTLTGGLQLLMADPRIAWPNPYVLKAWVLLSIAPFCAVLGCLTPKLIDEISHGDADLAGRAYALNVLGCILGPLAASYLLLPRWGVQWTSLALIAPVLCSGLWAWRQDGVSRSRGAALIAGAATAFLLVAGVWGRSYEDQVEAADAVILRDHTATVIGYHKDGDARLLVNGMLITSLSPSTKVMAHLPLATLEAPPASALVICFGMGTTYRSLLSWNIRTTAVELAPSVRDMFHVFHANSQETLRNPLGRIEIDDGRRFLRRTEETYDVITLDPPPPVEAAGSSLLYSVEFYDLVKRRLAERGILQQWYPGGDLRSFQAILHAIHRSFPHVRVTRACDGWGYHLLASRVPLPERSGEELYARLPPSAVADLEEWTGPGAGVEMLAAATREQVDVETAIANNPSAVVTDNRPYNEYYLLRWLWEDFVVKTYTIVL